MLDPPAVGGVDLLPEPSRPVLVHRELLVAGIGGEVGELGPGAGLEIE